MKINKRTLFENCNSFGISGVYAITNKTTGERYIGSSKDIRGRWCDHTSPSSWKLHPNSPLYSDMQKNGVENFTFTIVALVEPQHLREVEQSAMKMLNPTYNQNYAKGWDVDKRKASNKKHRQSDKGKAYDKKYKQSDKCKAHNKKYKSQLCEYNGETLTLHALSTRLYRMGIQHPVIEAKKYLKIK